MYSSSATTGDFENYIARDVVAYMDAHYRTIPSRQRPRLVGIQWARYGASRIGMKHPEVFGASLHHSHLLHVLRCRGDRPCGSDEGTGDCQ